MEATTRNPLGDHLAAEIAFQVECRDVLRSVLTARNTDEQRRLVLRLLDAAPDAGTKWLIIDLTLPTATRGQAAERSPKTLRTV